MSRKVYCAICKQDTTGNYVSKNVSGYTRRKPVCFVCDANYRLGEDDTESKQREREEESLWATDTCRLLIGFSKRPKR